MKGSDGRPDRVFAADQYRVDTRLRGYDSGEGVQVLKAVMPAQAGIHAVVVEAMMIWSLPSIYTVWMASIGSV